MEHQVIPHEILAFRPPAARWPSQQMSPDCLQTTCAGSTSAGSDNCTQHDPTSITHDHGAAKALTADNDTAPSDRCYHCRNSVKHMLRCMLYRCGRAVTSRPDLTLAIVALTGSVAISYSVCLIDALLAVDELRSRPGGLSGPKHHQFVAPMYSKATIGPTENAEGGQTAVSWTSAECCSAVSQRRQDAAAGRWP